MTRKWSIFQTASTRVSSSQLLQSAYTQNPRCAACFDVDSLNFFRSSRQCKVEGALFVLSKIHQKLVLCGRGNFRVPPPPPSSRPHHPHDVWILPQSRLGRKEGQHCPWLVAPLLAHCMPFQVSYILIISASLEQKKPHSYKRYTSSSLPPPKSHPSSAAPVLMVCRFYFDLWRVDLATAFFTFWWS